MTTKNLAIVALRLMGIYCLIEAAIVSQGLVFAYTMPKDMDPGRPNLILASLTPSLLLLGLGIVLLLFSKAVANLIVPQILDEHVQSTFSLHDLQSILFSVTGVFIVAFSIPRMFTWLSHIISLISNDSHGLPYSPKAVQDSWISFVLSSIEMFFGIGLFVGAKRVSNYWQRMREWSPSKGSIERT